MHIFTWRQSQPSYVNCSRSCQHKIHILFADFVDFYTHWTYILYMPIFSRIFLSNNWWQKSDIWSQASYRYPILWEAFFDPSDSYFLFAEERGYHKWALAHCSSCFSWLRPFENLIILRVCEFCPRTVYIWWLGLSPCEYMHIKIKYCSK
jgi:hypothetical protein